MDETCNRDIRYTRINFQNVEGIPKNERRKMEALQRIQTVFDKAAEDRDIAADLLASPAKYFRQAGVEIPEGHDEQFKDYFMQVAPEIVSALSHDDSAMMGAKYQEAVGSIGCTLCKIACYGIAVMLVGLGAAGIAALGPESAIVVWLAEFAGVSVEAVLEFLQTLVDVVGQGVSAVTEAICEWTGAC